MFRALRLTALPSRAWILVAVFSSSLGNGLIFGFQPPLIALVLSRAGASGLVIGAVTAASLIAVIALGPFYPRIIARFGPKRCIVAGVTGAALVLAVMPWCPGIAAWLCLRLLTGCALGLSWIASEVWITQVSDAASRGTVLGVYGTVFSTGVMAGPALLQATGTQGGRPYVIGAVCLLATLLPLLVLHRVTGVPQRFTPMRQLGRALRAAPVVMLAALVAGLTESAEVTLLPLFGLHAGLDDRGALLLVTVFMAGNVVLQAPIGLLADRHGRRRMLAFCAALSVVGPLLLRPSLGSPALLWPLLFLWGGTLYAFYSQGVALLGERFPTADLPTANTVFVMVYCLGGVAGPSLGGFAMDVWPDGGLPAVLSAAALALLAGLSVGVRQARAPTRRADGRLR